MKNSFTKYIILLWSNAEEILIIFFFATFAFNIRKVFLTKYSFLNGTYNDFLSISLSLSDMVILLLFFVITIKYIYCQYQKSVSFNTVLGNITQKLSNSTHYLFSINVSRRIILIIVFWMWICFSIIWSPFQEIAIYKAIIFSLIFIYFAILSHYATKKNNLLYKIKWALIFSGTIQSIIAVSQFIKNGSIGLHFLGESIINQNLPGVAKISIEGVKHIRAYGTFSHPNVLSSFLILSIFLLSEMIFNFMKTYYIEKNISRGTLKQRYVLAFILILFLINLLAFILTISRSAYFGLIIGIVLLFLKNFSIVFSFIKRNFILLIFLTVFVLSILFVSRHLLPSVFSTQSLMERNTYLEVSREIISKHPLLGSGIGQFVYVEYQQNNSLQGWQYQPVHNLYLLVTSELGLIGLATFIFILITLLFKSESEMNYSSLTNIWLYVIISFLVIAFFDHYYWDIEQGTIIFVAPFIFLFCKYTKSTAID